MTDKPSKRKGPTCPTCGDPVAAAYRPFCSRRCADIDLGRWPKGSYAIPGEPVDEAETVAGQPDSWRGEDS